MLAQADGYPPQRNLPSVLVVHVKNEAGLRMKSSAVSFGSTDLPDARFLRRGRSSKIQDPAVSVFSSGVCKRFSKTIQSDWVRRRRDEQVSSQTTLLISSILVCTVGRISVLMRQTWLLPGNEADRMLYKCLL